MGIENGEKRRESVNLNTLVELAVLEAVQKIDIPPEFAEHQGLYLEIAKKIIREHFNNLIDEAKNKLTDTKAAVATFNKNNLSTVPRSTLPEFIDEVGGQNDEIEAVIRERLEVINQKFSEAVHLNWDSLQKLLEKNNVSPQSAKAIVDTLRKPNLRVVQSD